MLLPWADSNRRPFISPWNFKSGCSTNWATRHPLICIIRSSGSCRCQTLPKILGYSLMTYSEPSLHLFALLKFRIPAAHSASINLPPSLGLTLLPITTSPISWAVGFGTYIAHLVVLTGWDTVSFHSFRFDVSFDAVSTLCNVQAFALAACTRQWSQLMLLPTYRDCTLHVPRRSWKVWDSNPRCPRFQDVPFQAVIHLCLRPLGQPSDYLCLSWFFFFCFGKTSGLHSRLGSKMVL